MKTLIMILLLSQIATSDFSDTDNSPNNTLTQQDFFSSDTGKSSCPMCGTNGYNNYSACTGCGYGGNNGQALGTNNTPLSGGIKAVFGLCFVYGAYMCIVSSKNTRNRKTRSVHRR